VIPTTARRAVMPHPPERVEKRWVIVLAFTVCAFMVCSLFSVRCASAVRRRDYAGLISVS